MHISRVRIENFRNFRELEVELDRQAVIVGENKVGKTNFLYALRLVLDPTLADVHRELRREDFWEGLDRPMANGAVIRVEIDFSDFEHDDNLIAILADHIVQAEPNLVARLTYVYQPHASGELEASGQPKYEFRVFGGGRQENGLSFEVRKYLPLKVLPALRDAEGDLESWRTSPLRPLIDNLGIGYERLKPLADDIDTASKQVAELEEVLSLNESIISRMKAIAGEHQGVQTNLGLLPPDPDRLLRSLKVFIDGSANRTMAEASLGTANLLYLTLLDLEIARQTAGGKRHHTFLGIEEPEAHLHPQLQRLVFRAYLHERHGAPAAPPASARSVLLTTLSPHIVSVAPLRSLVMLRDTQRGTVASSTTTLSLAEAEIADLERYIDATRGEMLFARGVILVEGMAEAILLPALARANGIYLDELGVSVCAINGTHFMPYIQFLNALSIPCVVVTDMDPTISARGDRRIASIKYRLDSPGASWPRNADVAEWAAKAKEAGLFVGTYTFEVDLFKEGLADAMRETLQELDDGERGERANRWDPDALDIKGFLDDIKAIGKGRFAQRLARKVVPGSCPTYIREALEFVRDQVIRDPRVGGEELSRSVPQAIGRAKDESTAIRGT